MNRFASTLATLTASGNLRSIPPHRNGGALVDLSSNDYLGLAERPDLQELFFSEATRRAIPMTSSASRLLSGRQLEYAALESLLAELYGRPALLFNSGYHANTGLLSALAQGGDTLIVADRLAHASMIDGMVLAKTPFTRFRHNDTLHLRRILEKEHSAHSLIVVVVESIYSMDGDAAPLADLIAIKRAYPNVMLYVDEAHAFGAIGPRGLGLSRSLPDYDEIDIIVGTFGKACASMGAFAVTSTEVRAYLVNRARSLIFSTALPPMQAAWTEFMIRTFLPMDAERTHLANLSRLLADSLGNTGPASHIQPYIVGDAALTVALSAILRERGFEVLPIRTPTVPPGTERLRISLSAARTPAQITAFTTALTATNH